MKTEFTLQLRDTPRNRQKAKLMSRLEIAFDDPATTLPKSYYELAEGIPWGAKVQITMEVIPPEGATK